MPLAAICNLSYCAGILDHKATCHRVRAHSYALIVRRHDDSGSGQKILAFWIVGIMDTQS